MSAVHCFPYHIPTLVMWYPKTHTYFHSAYNSNKLMSKSVITSLILQTSDIIVPWNSILLRVEVYFRLRSNYVCRWGPATQDFLLNTEMSFYSTNFSVILTGTQCQYSLVHLHCRRLTATMNTFAEISTDSATLPTAHVKEFQRRGNLRMRVSE